MAYKYLYSILALLIFFNTDVAGQNDSIPAYITEMKNRLENNYVYTMEVAEKMPEELYDYRTNNEVMSFKEQLLHIITHNDMLNANYLKNKCIETEIVGQLYSKNEILELLLECKNNSIDNFNNLTEEELNNVVRTYAGRMTKRSVFNLMMDHTTHHRSQLIIFLRLNNIIPPTYRGW